MSAPKFDAPAMSEPVADPTEAPKRAKRKYTKKGRPSRIPGLPEPPDGIPYAHKVKPPKKYWEVFVMHKGNNYGPFYEMGWDENEAAHDVNMRHADFADTHTRYYIVQTTPDKWNAGRAKAEARQES